MFADLLPPPTFDWGVLGFPTGPFVFLAVAASVLTTGVVLSRRRVRAIWIVVWCLFLFVVLVLIAVFLTTQVRQGFPQ